MKFYVVTITGGKSFRINEKEYKAMAGKTGLLFFPSAETTIHTDMIKMIRPYEDELAEARKEQTEGVLHDGTRVIKKFGSWVMMDNPDVRIDPKYYPEVAKDCIPTTDEFENQYLALPREERLAKMLGVPLVRLGGKDIKQLKA